jgi:hypothetical protein
MFTLARTLPVKSLLLEQAPPLVVSIVIAELFYKLGSFSLECLAFLTTWFLLDWAFTSVSQLFRQFTTGRNRPGIRR